MLLKLKTIVIKVLLFAKNIEYYQELIITQNNATDVTNFLLFAIVL